MDKTDWKWKKSLPHSDSRQITYCCALGNDDIKRIPGRFGVDKISDAGKRAFADATGLRIEDIKDWAKYANLLKVGDNIEIFFSIARIWLCFREWQWRRHHTNRDIAQFVTPFGEKMNARYLQKLRSGNFTIKDIAPAAQNQLAVKAGLLVEDITKWAKVSGVVEYPDGFTITVDVSLEFLNRRSDYVWQWRSAGYNEDKTLKYYVCTGREISKRLLDKTRRTKADHSMIPLAAWSELGEEVGLDSSEAWEWGQDLSTFGGGIRVGVPNVWICADLLRGGGIWDTLVNFGGTIGQAISYLGTWDKKEIICETIEDLEKNFEDAEYRGRIWGFVLYAHGDQFGNIAPPVKTENSKSHLTLVDLIGLVKAQNFKLARLCLMPCDSGHQGSAEIRLPTMQKFKEKKIPSLKNKSESYIKMQYQSYVASVANQYTGTMLKKMLYAKNAKFCFDWNTPKLKAEVDLKAEWAPYVVGGEPTISYRGWNVAALDLGWPELWGEWFVKTGEHIEKSFKRHW